MRRLLRWILRLLAGLTVLAALLLAPVAWVEWGCRTAAAPPSHDSLLPPEHHRPAARTLLTYPEWHIVHAYDDYAEVIATQDPHDFGYLRAVRSFWSSLCRLNRAAGALGGADAETRQMVYVIGTSFTVEMALKAAYEETLGRLFVWLRGPRHAPLDTLSARQAAAYATFLQQIPWYEWDFAGDRAALAAAATESLRDRERRIALGLEYGAKQVYAGLIGRAVASVGPDEQRLRMVVTGVDRETLARYDGLTVIGARGEGIEIETVRYRALTELLKRLAAEPLTIREIAGNDRILLTITSPAATMPGALLSLPRQGHGDWRHLFLVPVAELMAMLRKWDGSLARVEHVHDY